MTLKHKLLSHYENWLDRTPIWKACAIAGALAVAGWGIAYCIAVPSAHALEADMYGGSGTGSGTTSDWGAVGTYEGNFGLAPSYTGSINNSGSTIGRSPSYSGPGGNR